MKVILNCHVPVMLAHGGAHIQIEQTSRALEKIGVEVEPLRWWDEEQSGDILHHFGRIPLALLNLAQQKGIKVIMADLLTAQGSRSWSKLRLQKSVMRTFEAGLPSWVTDSFNWNSYRQADACIALTPWEARLMHFLFNAPENRTHVVPNGVEEVFLNSQPLRRGEWLVCTATITERKRVLELAQAAVEARTPIWIIGKAYTEKSPYFQKFLAVAREHPSFVRYEGAIRNREHLAKIYREAHGFVLLSEMESLSLSALEAAACECPLLLADLPWARTVFQESASYCPVGNLWTTVPFLRQFYDAAPRLPRAGKPLTWEQVANQLKNIYSLVLNSAGQ